MSSTVERMVTFVVPLVEWNADRPTSTAPTSSSVIPVHPRNAISPTLSTVAGMTRTPLMPMEFRNALGGVEWHPKRAKAVAGWE